MDYASFAIGGVAILPLVIGLVEFAKKFGLAGNALTGLSAALGFVFIALAYAIETGLMPEAAVPWIALVVVGLGGGLAASGLYDLGKKFFLRHD